MLVDTVRSLGTYVLGAMIVAACFYLIQGTSGEHVQEWATISGIIGYLIRDAGGSAGTRAAERIQNATAANMPTTSVTTGPPATATVSPAADAPNGPPIVPEQTYGFSPTQADDWNPTTNTRGDAP